MPTEKERLDAVEPTVAELVTRLQLLTAELGRVGARLQVLERRLAGAGSGPDEDFDALDGEVGDIVAALRAAWEAEQEVLADSVRIELRQEVAEYEALKERRDAGRARLAAGRMPRFERDQLDHEVHQLDWQIGAAEPGAQDAAARLEADSAAAEDPRRQEAILAGEKAREEIWDAATRRLERALAADTRLPVWFRVGLGEIPSPNPNPWVRAATGLIAYRLEYGVTTAVDPLGDPPTAGSGSAAWVRRTEVHTDLADQLETLRP
ncbi:hypothetical protein ABZ816_34825 [Actinosynnema sp. NPDC047251]|uniref:Uncharacterized protein n=1 Tax=Saccharothrix espanaensis (strain ATCC 51144 / DSM 44229 / JCM 9112 / NBRC 15066 / NRRL 15764) TaxID=1179773 RepID=K0JSZ5_SACES|nr:hypothetical protein [Saccharothrix espanaensis]CCH28622.1 hypothetical protein BN6_12960 [Saccharothrix espanaensis DSM 44229]